MEAAHPKIQEIELSWFRGAADRATLKPMSKNLVVYGANGSGKSSFVDGLEYIISNERIEHLAHEYSGHRQLLGVRNTHAPAEASSMIHLVFDAERDVSAVISSDGRVKYQDSPPGLLEKIREWDLMRTVLRQDKVADFIHRTKGQKYAELLPLLGLQTHEYAADNLRKLKEEIENQANESIVNATHGELLEQATERSATLERTEVLKRLEVIARRYGVGLGRASAIGTLATTLESELNAKVSVLEPAQRRHVLLKQILDEDFEGKRQKVKETRAQVLDALDHQIEVLVQTEKIVHEIELVKEIACPACGKLISVEELKTHVSVELDRLHGVREARDRARAALREFVDGVKRALHLMKSETLAEWLSDPSNIDVRTALGVFDEVDFLNDTTNVHGELPENAEMALDTILNSAKKSESDAPLPLQQLLDDLKFIEKAKSLEEIRARSQLLSSVNLLNNRLETGEEAIRGHIRSEVEEIVSRCSSAIQGFWSVLHPNEPIDGLQLTTIEDKAVEVQLKFFGKPQPSPRLTLSEGHRNSLALCIFLALADVSETEDIPILLDDIVSSLDRDHRGRVAHILIDKLGNRQILVFTHDREWYAELKSVLPQSKWSFCTLRPWSSPAIGIQLTQSKETFDDSRQFLAIRPESAGNAVRSIMDRECAIAAESLKIAVPYRSGDANDRRSCIEFLNEMCADGRSRLKRDPSRNCDDILSVWKKANTLLKGFANRASHTGSLTDVEANDLIDACEAAVKSFRCEGCGDLFWVAEVENKRVQCGCGKLYWVLT